MQSLDALAEIGLNQKEAAIYLAALELGETSMLEIARKSGIRRSTVYEVIEKLVEKGFVTTVVKEKKKRIIAIAPKDLLGIIQQKETLLKNVLPQLESVYNLAPVKPRVRYYEGRKGVETVLRETLSCKEKVIYYIFPDKYFFERVDQDFTNWLLEERVRRKIRTRTIRKSGERTGWKYGSPKLDKKVLRESRFVGSEFQFDSTIGVYDDKVMIIMPKKEGVAVVIESPDYAKTMKTLHKALWQTGGKR